MSPWLPRPGSPPSPSGRYLTYLTQQGEVVSRVNYDTGGRPSLLYHLPKDRP